MIPFFVCPIENISGAKNGHSKKFFKELEINSGRKDCQTGQLWPSGVRQFGPSGRKYAP